MATIRCTNENCNMILMDDKGMFEIRQYTPQYKCGHCGSVAEELKNIAMDGKDPFYPELTKHLKGEYFFLWKNEKDETFYKDTQNKKFIPYSVTKDVR